MLFPNTTLEELTSEEVYEFDECKPVYLALLQYYSDLFDYPREQDRWNRGDADYRNGCLWWVMNEAWQEYGTLKPDLPYRWLAISKRALYWDHIPVNFYPSHYTQVVNISQLSIKGAIKWAGHNRSCKALTWETRG